VVVASLYREPLGELRVNYASRTLPRRPVHGIDDAEKSPSQDWTDPPGAIFPSLGTAGT